MIIHENPICYCIFTGKQPSRKSSLVLFDFDDDFDNNNDLEGDYDFDFHKKRGSKDQPLFGMKNAKNTISLETELLAF